MINSIGNGAAAIPGQSPNSQPAASSKTSGVDGLANEQTFLKLLVAQLRNQNPLQPQDPMQFVGQLAQFSSLEQELQMRQDLDAIKNQGGAPPPPKS